MKETTLTLEQIETIITGYPDAPYFIRQSHRYSSGNRSTTF